MASLHKIIDAQHDSLVWQCWDCGWESFPIELDEAESGIPEHECRQSERRTSSTSEKVKREHSKKHKKAAS